MLRYVRKRLLWMIPVILGVTILIFTIMYFVPGNVAELMLGSEATKAEIEMLSEELGLNDPYIVQLGRYLNRLFLHLDFGNSITTGTSVADNILLRMPQTLTMAIVSIMLALVIGIPLGIIAAMNQGKLGDSVSMVVALAGVSMPPFWLALMMVLLFSLKLEWLPPMGYGGLEYYIMPCVANCFHGLAMIARQTRSSMLEVIRSDYITTARAKGQSKFRIIVQHALPNALIPVITVAGTTFGKLLGGTVVLESIFSIPGLGTYMINGVNARDSMVVQGCVIFLAITFSLLMLVVDLIYAAIDPRIRAQYAGRKRRRRNAKQ